MLHIYIYIYIYIYVCVCVCVCVCVYMCVCVCVCVCVYIYIYIYIYIYDISCLRVNHCVVLNPKKLSCHKKIKDIDIETQLSSVWIMGFPLALVERLNPTLQTLQ